MPHHLNLNIVTFILLLLDAPASCVAGSERQQQQLLEREHTYLQLDAPASCVAGGGHPIGCA
jgi:hypothetical protein